MRANRRHQKVLVDKLGTVDQVRTKPDKTKKNVTPLAPKRKSRSGAQWKRLSAWTRKTARAANHRSDVRQGRPTAFDVRDRPDTCPNHAAAGPPTSRRITSTV